MNVAALCGATDWRLPSRRELLTIVHAGATNPSIDGTYFSNASAASPWTSTTYAGDPTYAWLVDFVRGFSFNGGKVTRNFVVRLVRGGE